MMCCTAFCRVSMESKALFTRTDDVAHFANAKNMQHKASANPLIFWAFFNHNLPRTYTQQLFGFDAAGRGEAFGFVASNSLSLRGLALVCTTGKHVSQASSTLPRAPAAGSPNLACSTQARSGGIGHPNPPYPQLCLCTSPASSGTATLGLSFRRSIAESTACKAAAIEVVNELSAQQLTFT